jgi:putative PEP-CTERM system TPR-repeat lipoprotein
MYRENGRQRIFHWVIIGKSPSSVGIGFRVYIMGSKLGKIIAFVILITGLLACGETMTEEAYLSRAQDYLATSDHRSAVIELKNALRQNPESVQARLLLGTAYFELGDIPSAEKELVRVQEAQGPQDSNRLMPLLAQAWTAMGKFDQVLAIEIDNLSPASTAMVLAAQAQSSFSLADMGSANQKIDESLKLQPNSAYAQNVKIRLLIIAGELEMASDLADNVHEVSPENSASWALQGDIRMLQGDIEQTEEYYSKAVKLAPNDLELRVKRAFLRIQAQQLDLAQKDVDVLLQHSAQNAQINFAQGLIHYFNGQYEDAVDALVIAEAEKFRFPQIMLYLGLANFQLGNIDKAYNDAQDYYAVEEGNSAGRKLLATLWVIKGLIIDAEQLSREILDRNPDDIEALNILASSLLKQGRIEEAVEALVKVVEMEPGSPQAQVRLGAGYFQLGQSEEAEGTLRTAIELDPEYAEADVLLVANYIKEGELDNALEAANDSLLRNPKSPFPYLLLAQVYRLGDDSEAVFEAYKKALALEPGNVRANHRLAELALFAGDVDMARNHYSNVLTEHERNVETLMALAELEAGVGNYPAMVDYLESAIEAHPHEVQPKIALAQYHLQSGRADKVALTLSALSQEQLDSPTLMRLLARAHLVEAKYDDARYILERLLELTPNRGAAEDYRLLGLAFAGIGDDEKMLRHLKTSEDIDPDNVETQLALARYAFTQGDAKVFEVRLEKLLTLSPDDERVKRLEIAYLAHKGDATGILALREEIFQSSPSTRNMLELRNQYAITGDSDAAGLLLESWVEEHQEDVVARLALASSYTGIGDEKRLVAEYSNVLKLDSDNIVALNNLAWSLKGTDKELALEYANRAAALNENVPQVLDTLAMVLSANEKHAEAKKVISDALALASPDAPETASILYHSAFIANAAGDKSEAVTILQQLLQSAVSFPEHGEAVALMEALGSAK